MKLYSLALLLGLLAPAFAQQRVPEIPYQANATLLKLPANLYLGEAAGVAVNSKGHIFVFTRGGHSMLLEFDGQGKFIREIGHDLYGFVFAHAVRIDKNDDIWCIDEGSNMVIEFSPEGRVLMVFGRRPEPTESARPRQPGAPPPPARTWIFNRPTDIAWDAAGDSFISDGYGNSRVVKIDKEGNWVKAWGERGTAPGQFNTPHSIATDAAGNVYVGDRGNKRIQVFNGDGAFLKEFTGIGSPWAICITPGPNQVLYSADSGQGAMPGPGRIYKMDLNGKILGAFGKGGKQPGEFGWIHEMACPSENTLYVGEILNWRVQKLTLRPAR